MEHLQRRMGEPVTDPREQLQGEAKFLVYMPQVLKDELMRRARASNSEGYSGSKLVRTALREYFKRHPA